MHANVAHRSSAQAGFSLVETLIALVFFSIMAVAFTRYTAQQSRSLEYLTTKTLGTIIAANTLTEMQLQHQFPLPGHLAREVNMAERNWHISITITPTTAARLRSLEVGVAPTTDGPDVAPVASLVGFVSQP